MWEAKAHSNCKRKSHVAVENVKITLSVPAPKITHHHATTPGKQRPYSLALKHHFLITTYLFPCELRLIFLAYAYLLTVMTILSPCPHTFSNYKV